jgi:PD-(D/E)XK nuclease superfamily
VPAALQTKHTYTVRQHDGRILRVVGWSDRVDSDGATVDHKWTGSRPWNEEGEWDQGWALDKRDQLCMYWLARRAEERRGVAQFAPVAPRGRLEVLYMRVGQGEPQLNTLEFEFGPEDEHRVLEMVREADAILQAGRLPARPGDPCGFCSYRSLCRRHEERAATLTPFATLVGAVE